MARGAGPSLWYGAALAALRSPMLVSLLSRADRPLPGRCAQRRRMPMLAQRPRVRPTLAALLGGLLLAPALPAAAQTAPAQATAKPELGPVEELYKQRQYEAALRKADELKGAGELDADNEYWAARALRVMKRSALTCSISKSFARLWL